MCLQNALSGYFQTNCGNFWSHFRAESFWDIDQRANSHRKTNGSVRLKKFRTVCRYSPDSIEVDLLQKVAESFHAIFEVLRQTFQEIPTNQ